MDGINYTPPSKPSYTGSLLTVGTSLYPQYQNATLGVADITSGAFTFTLVSGTAYLGARLSTYWTEPCVITGIAGSTITTSKAANSTASGVSIQFGTNRWDTTSAELVNTLGVRTIWAGAASLGGTTWAQKYLSGDADFGGKVTASILADTQTIALFTGTKSSRSTFSTYTIAHESLAINDDSSTSKYCWNHYSQTEVLSGASATSLNFGNENNVYNENTAVQTDPYRVNIVTGTVNQRLSAGFTSGGTDCSTALDVIGIGTTKFRSGVIVADGALSTSTNNNPPALSLPAGTNGYAVTWYRAVNSIGWKLYANNASVAGNELVLQDSNFIWKDGSATYLTAGKTSLTQSALNAGASIIAQRTGTFSAGNTAAAFAGYGPNSSAADTAFGQITVTANSVTAGAEQGVLNFQTQNAGSLASRFIVSSLSASMSVPLTVSDMVTATTTTKVTESAGAAIVLAQRTGAFIAGNTAASFKGNAPNDAASDTTFAQINVSANNVSAGAENGVLNFQTNNNGTLATRLSITGIAASLNLPFTLTGTVDMTGAGTASAPTPTAGDSSTKIATTAFVAAAATASGITERIRRQQMVP